MVLPVPVQGEEMHGQLRVDAVKVESAGDDIGHLGVVLPRCIGCEEGREVLVAGRLERPSRRWFFLVKGSLFRASIGDSNRGWTSVARAHTMAVGVAAVGRDRGGPDVGGPRRAIPLLCMAVPLCVG